MREKNGKCNQDYFSQVLLKSYWTSFKTIFETLSALGPFTRLLIEGHVFDVRIDTQICGFIEDLNFYLKQTAILPIHEGTFTAIYCVNFFRHCVQFG